MSRSATRPGAASTPAWRMPPPRRLRSRRAAATTSSSPASSDPTGAHSPLDRQHITVVADRAHCAAATPVAASALKSRAPSRWIGTGPAASTSARRRASFQTAPDAAMCVFSMLTSDTSGWWCSRRPARPSHVVGVHHAVGVVDGVELDAGVLRRRAVLVRDHVLAAPGDDGRAGRAQDAQGHLVRHHAGGDEERGRLPDPRREGLLERPDGRILPVVVVAHLGLGHGAPHGGRGPGDGVAAQVDGAGHAVRLNGAPLASAGDHSPSPRVHPSRPRLGPAGHTPAQLRRRPQRPRPVGGRDPRGDPRAGRHAPAGGLEGAPALRHPPRRRLGPAGRVGRELRCRPQRPAGSRRGGDRAQRQPSPLPRRRAPDRPGDAGPGRSYGAGLGHRLDRRRRPGHLRRPLHAGRDRHARAAVRGRVRRSSAGRRRGGTYRCDPGRKRRTGSIAGIGPSPHHAGRTGRKPR